MDETEEVPFNMVGHGSHNELLVLVHLAMGNFLSLILVLRTYKRREGANEQTHSE